MKNNLWKAIVACSLLCTVICMARIGELKRDVQNLNNQLNNRIAQLENNLWQNNANIEEMLKQEASILSKAEWEYGKFHAEDLTVDVVCKVTPKEYDPENITASILAAGQEFPMTYQDGNFKATVPASIFEEIQIEQVKFQEGNQVRVEELAWVIMPIQTFLASADAYLGGTTIDFGGNKKAIWSSQDTLQVFIGKKDYDHTVKSITLVRYLDGKETDRMKLPLEGFEQPITDYYHTLDLNYEIPYGSLQELYIDIEDGLGLRYRSCIDYTSIDEHGNHVDDTDAYSIEKIVYDQDDKELYRGYW